MWAPAPKGALKFPGASVAHVSYDRPNASLVSLTPMGLLVDPNDRISFRVSQILSYTVLNLDIRRRWVSETISISITPFEENTFWFAESNEEHHSNNVIIETFGFNQFSARPRTQRASRGILFSEWNFITIFNNSHRLLICMWEKNYFFLPHKGDYFFRIN